MNNEAMKDIIDRIRQRRLELGYSFQDLANLTHMSKSTLQRYETGGIKNLPLDKLKILAQALQTTPEWIMGWDLLDEKQYNDFLKEFIDAPEEIITLNRAAKNMSPENRKKLLEMAKLMFKEDFPEDE